MSVYHKREESSEDIEGILQTIPIEKSCLCGDFCQDDTCVIVSGRCKTTKKNTIFRDNAEKRFSIIAPELMHRVVDTAGGRLFQAFIFFCMVLLLGFSPIVKSYALMDPVTGLKNPSFIPQ
eukprot:GHVP01029592.1.p1 GENE.GHVP01029592.1~~GHVP01029592.1.p1  ORF type:complete len:121 (+),score=17.79 GHVP01029592.1:349-711(+)